ncbi:MAG: hypothetical protein J6B41_07110 [Alistipes sp.]|nr:hypothetical protein [Alistipes sp.]
MAQLKINDLSVGDWVSDKNGIIAQIRGMECWSDGYVINVQTKAGTITNLTEAGVCPIPITPEILEKNGFVKNDAYLHKIDIDDNITIGVRRQSDGYMFELKREKRRIGELLAIIRGLRNVHQLQHALRLAGVEKEIVV